ncbi:Hpt domain-containing protein [Paenarthrobacter sp. NPDC089322]|uniref:Hpt domain-containing protein n=1 Tax=Paenarthrobacter sp. NPDC089322 TaxID=3155065 RepID=UPI0034408273
MFSSEFIDVNEEPDPVPVAVASNPSALRGARMAMHPILDLAEFQFLEDQVDNPLTARTFAGDFAKLWSVRLGILEAAVEGGDSTAALDAILSLRTSSTMVGGVRLAILAEQLEEYIRNGDMGEVQPLLADVAECGDRTVQELMDSYVLRNL